MLELVTTALMEVCNWPVILVILAAAAYGIFVGSMPGLTATMAVSLMVPLTFYLNETEAIAAIVTTVTCSIFAGDIPAALVRIPGTPASAAYAADAYALTQRGLADRALSVALISSVCGGLFGTVVLVCAAPLLAMIARSFTSFEYFWLYVLGLTCAAVVSDEARLRGACALLLGLLFSTVGLGTDYSQPRLTFGRDELITGINFIPAMIGLFGVSEVLRNALFLDPPRSAGDRNVVPATTADTVQSRQTPAGRTPAIRFAVTLTLRRAMHLIRSSSIGSFIGMLPGAGADIAAWISYAVSKRFARRPEEYGRGSVEGLGDATGANNAALGSAWIPALVFGIPGDSVTAIALGVLMMKNIRPGPDIFDFTSKDAQGVLVISIFITFVLANLVLVPLGALAIRVGTVLVRIPRRVMLPMIFIFCLVGAYAMNASYFDVSVMLVMGLVGFLLERARVPLGPVVLGIILGGELEHRFIQSITKSDSPFSFFASPIRIVLALVTITVLCGPTLVALLKRRWPR